VLTASRASEYSFEGEPVEGAAEVGSVFTSALVAGLRTGDADADRDGYITVDEAYAYAFDQMKAIGANQTPQRWLFGAEGRIVLARAPRAIADEDIPQVAEEPDHPTHAIVVGRSGRRLSLGRTRFSVAGAIVTVAVLVGGFLVGKQLL